MILSVIADAAAPSFKEAAIYIGIAAIIITGIALLIKKTKNK